MSVWDAPGEMPSIFTVAAVNERRVGLYAFESCFCCVNRILMRDSEKFTSIPNKLSAAMIGAFRAMCGRVVDSVETSYAQWQQVVVRAVQAVARRSRAATAKPLTVTPIRALGRGTAFLLSRKINGRNAQ